MTDELNWSGQLLPLPDGNSQQVAEKVAEKPPATALEPAGEPPEVNQLSDRGYARRLTYPPEGVCHGWHPDQNNSKG